MSITFRTEIMPWLVTRQARRRPSLRHSGRWPVPLHRRSVIAPTQAPPCPPAQRPARGTAPAVSVWPDSRVLPVGSWWCGCCGGSSARTGRAGSGTVFWLRFSVYRLPPAATVSARERNTGRSPADDARGSQHPLVMLNSLRWCPLPGPSVQCAVRSGEPI